LFVPTDEASQKTFKQNLAASASYASEFCARNPGTCATGLEYWGIFKKKAEVAGTLAFELAKERMLGAATGAAGAPARDAGETPPTTKPSKRALETPRAQPAHYRGTLTEQDLKPAWRGL
jgi:hypothetical protein